MTNENGQAIPTIETQEPISLQNFEKSHEQV